MGIEVWHMWIIIALLLLIAEIFVPTFLAACLAIGCAGAGLFSCAGLGINLQLTALSAGVLAGFFGVRPFMLRYAYKDSKNTRTNADALIGKTGIVYIAVDNSKKIGRVTIDGEDWRAESENGALLEAGERVVVVKVISTLAIVKKINRGI